MKRGDSGKFVLSQDCSIVVQKSQEFENMVKFI